MPAIARLAGKRVRSSECLPNNETVSKCAAAIRADLSTPRPRGALPSR